MATLPSGLPDHVADGEDLARFLTSSSHFNAVMVKPVKALGNSVVPQVVELIGRAILAAEKRGE